MNPDQADGSVSNRRRMPGRRRVKHNVVECVGDLAIAQQRENSSKAAISTVQDPENCSSMLRMAASGSTPRYGPTIRSRYWRVAASGFRFIAEDSARHAPGCRKVVQRFAQYIVQVRGRVRGHQQHALASIGQLYCTGAGQRGLAHTSFAGKEKDTRWLGEKLHHRILRLSNTRYHRSNHPLWKLPPVVTTWARRCQSTAPVLRVTDSGRD